MSRQQTYSGSCHCGRVRFEVVTELARASVCSACGVHAFGRFEADGTERVVVNVRRLDGVELGALEVQSFDGRRC